jgi:hypothetical protein
MRFVRPLAAFALIALLTLGQTSSPATAPPTATAKASAAPVQHHRMAAGERFAKANTTHDGHLTLAPAKTGYPTKAQHFSEVDTAKKGYVTADRIRAWAKAEREQRHVGQQAAAPPIKG